MDDTMFAQAGLFALEVALFGLLEGWGVRPDFVVGHSIGELAAAYVAGVFSLEDACRLVGARGRLMGALPEGGAMVSVQVSEEEALGSLADWEGRVSLAAVNGPAAVVFSGDEDAVLELAGVWRERGRKVKRLRVSHAFHSPRMDGMLREFADVAESIEFHAPRIPVVSNVTGEAAVAEEMCSAGYWVRHVREPVRFLDGVRWLAARGVNRFLELGPEGVLAAMAQDCLAEEADDARGSAGPPVAVAVLRGGRPEVQALFGALAEVWVRGVDVDWPRVFAGSGARRVALPTYAFQRERYWLSMQAGGAVDLASAGLESADHPLLSSVVTPAEGEGRLFTGRLSLESHPWLADHVLMGMALLPGTAFVELALRAGSEVGCETIGELTLHAPLVLPEQGSVQMQVVVGEQDESGDRTVRIYSRAEDAADGPGDEAQAWTCHASGVLLRVPDRQDAWHDRVWPANGAEPIDIADLYDRLLAQGFDYGPAFQGVRKAWRHGDEICTEVELPEDQRAQAGLFGLHPALLDATFHAMLGVVYAAGDRKPLVPFSWNGVRLHATGASSLRARLLLSSANGGMSMVVTDGSGEPVLSVDTLVAREISSEQLAGAGAGRTYRNSLFRMDWVPIAAGPSADRWVVLGSDESALGQALRASGSSPAFHADMETLAREFAEETPFPDLVLVDMTADAVVEDGVPGSAREALHRGLALIQEWLLDERLAAPRLVFLTSGAVAARPGEGVSDLIAAPLWGLVRSAQSENPQRFVLVDLDGASSSLDALGAALGSGEAQLALRDGAILAPRLGRLGATIDDGPFRFSSDGTVLITGGTGGLGGAVARHIVADHGVRSVMLTSRRGREAEGAAELEAELTGLGARVEIAACDVADRGQLEQLIGSVPDEYPLIGVVHTAGTADNGLIGSLTREQLDRVLAPKVDGALHLHELTEHLDLQAFVLYSSLASIFGGPGQANYAAGNAFLDALTEHRRARGLPATAIAWGLWKEVGMGRYLDKAAVRTLSGSAALGLLTPEQGVELFDAAIASGEAMLAAVHVDTRVLGAEAKAGVLPPLLSALVRAPRRRAQDAARESLVRRLIDTPEDERGRVALEEVRTHVAVILGHDSREAVQAEKNFLELGFDSLAAVELRNRLNTVAGLRLPATLVFDHPTPLALAEQLLAEVEAGSEQFLTAGGQSVEPRTPDGESHDTLSALFKQAHSVGMTDEFLQLLGTASKFRQTFDAPLGPAEGPAAIRLSTGPERPALICVPSLLAAGGPHQYVRFAKPFHGVRDVWALSTPGYLKGELVPATFEVAIETQAGAVRAQAGEDPFVIVGHSTGGSLAYAVAAHLEGIGVPPAAVVLIDTYVNEGFFEALPRVFDRVLERDEIYAAMSDVGLTAMGAYARLLAEWTPTAIAAPTLLVQATEPMPGTPEGAAWGASWDFAHTAVAAPGDHFTMMEEHAASAAEAVQKWILNTLPQT
ncbi:MAG: SDR family NAD(P)-dependent oxidoreductase [Solirubrobacterales bacterium]